MSPTKQSPFPPHISLALRPPATLPPLAPVKTRESSCPRRFPFSSPPRLPFIHRPFHRLTVRPRRYVSFLNARTPLLFPPSLSICIYLSRGTDNGNNRAGPRMWNQILRMRSLNRGSLSSAILLPRPLTPSSFLRRPFENLSSFRSTVTLEML